MSAARSRRAGSAPTLSDVARAAGVSPMTVSRVINKDSAVREQTRERVEAAVVALNYAPNTAARVLAGAAQIRFALVYGNPSVAYLSEVLVGGLDMATRGDVQLLLENGHDDAEPAGIARRVIARGLDGVILPAPFCDRPELIAELLAADIPTAMIASGAPDANCISVSIDDVQASADMTRHLIGLGHRRVGFVVGNPNQTASAKRLRGYRLAMGQAGLDVDESLIAQGDFSYRSGLAAAEQLLDAAVRPTAIFASNDDMAAAAVAVAHRRRLEVPGDLSVCGFDDTALATTLSPELTTVRQPAADMARAAVEMLTTAVRQRRLGKMSPQEHRLFAHQIMRRESDGAPNS